MESKNKFTPGPWSINNNIGRKGEIGILADSAPCIIAIMGNQKEWPTEAYKNARLIAAAPRMYGALEMIERDIDTALLYKRISKKTAEDILETISEVMAEIKE